MYEESVVYQSIDILYKILKWKNKILCFSTPMEYGYDVPYQIPVSSAPNYAGRVTRVFTRLRLRLSISLFLSPLTPPTLHT